MPRHRRVNTLFNFDDPYLVRIFLEEKYGTSDYRLLRKVAIETEDMWLIKTLGKLKRGKFMR